MSHTHEQNAKVVVLRVSLFGALCYATMITGVTSLLISIQLAVDTWLSAVIVSLRSGLSASSGWINVIDSISHRSTPRAINALLVRFADVYNIVYYSARTSRWFSYLNRRWLDAHCVDSVSRRRHVVGVIATYVAFFSKFEPISTTGDTNVTKEDFDDLPDKHLAWNWRHYMVFSEKATISVCTCTRQLDKEGKIFNGLWARFHGGYLDIA